MGKPTTCIGENKGADQLRSNRYTDTCSTIPLPSKSKIPSLKPASAIVQPGLCRTLSEHKLMVFSRTDSYGFLSVVMLCNPKCDFN